MAKNYYANKVATLEAANLALTERLRVMTAGAGPLVVERTDLQSLAPCGLIVALHGWVRLTWKGEPPRLPNMVSDMDGRLWVCQIDYTDKIVTVEEQTGAYGDRSEKVIKRHPYTLDDFDNITMPSSYVEKVA